MECPKEECAPGYVIVYTNSATSVSGSELPPPRPRHTYSRYRPGNTSYAGTKNAYTKNAGYTKNAPAKGGYSGSKGGYTGFGKLEVLLALKIKSILGKVKTTCLPIYQSNILYLHLHIFFQ